MDKNRCVSRVIKWRGMDIRRNIPEKMLKRWGGEKAGMGFWLWLLGMVSPLCPCSIKLP
jgi:hypothetical protein